MYARLLVVADQHVITLVCSPGIPYLVLLAGIARYHVLRGLASGTNIVVLPAARAVETAIALLASWDSGMAAPPTEGRRAPAALRVGAGRAGLT
jgi:hypothetical protein